jgi:hypothetical protein
MKVAPILMMILINALLFTNAYCISPLSTIGKIEDESDRNNVILIQKTTKSNLVYKYCNKVTEEEESKLKLKCKLLGEGAYTPKQIQSIVQEQYLKTGIKLPLEIGVFAVSTIYLGLFAALELGMAKVGLYIGISEFLAINHLDILNPIRTWKIGRLISNGGNTSLNLENLSEGIDEELCDLEPIERFN